MRREELTVPDPRCRSNSHLVHRTSNQQSSQEKGSIPPWEYKMHRISSISGWYAPLSRDVSEFCEGTPASLSTSGDGPDTTPFEIGTRSS